jgi:hypothetical protein
MTLPRLAHLPGGAGHPPINLTPSLTPCPSPVPLPALCASSGRAITGPQALPAACYFGGNTTPLPCPPINSGRSEPPSGPPHRARLHACPPTPHSPGSGPSARLFRTMCLQPAPARFLPGLDGTLVAARPPLRMLPRRPQRLLRLPPSVRAHHNAHIQRPRGGHGFVVYKCSGAAPASGRQLGGSNITKGGRVGDQGVVWRA